jgi:hypothetical protein
MPNVSGSIPLSIQSLTLCVLASRVDVTHSWIPLSMIPTQITELRTNSKGEQMSLKQEGHQSQESGLLGACLGGLGIP